MRHKLLATVLGGALCLVGTVPATAASTVTAHAGSQSLLLGGQSVSPNGDSFWNGSSMVPVSLVYQGRIYVAARYAASIANLGISWQRKSQIVTLRGKAGAIANKKAAQVSFNGPVAVEVRRVRLVVRGHVWTPAGRLFSVGGQRLPDALYAMRTMYMPASLLATALGLKLTWPPNATAPTGFYAHISLPVSTLQPGSVLSVTAIVGGVPASDPLGFTWTLRNPEGNLVPLMGGSSAKQEQIPFGANAARGTYRLGVTVTDGHTGQRTTAFANIHLQGNPPAGVSVPTFGYSPQEIARAYDIYSTWLGGDFGQGQAIVLYEPQGYSYQDIATFDDTFGLPAPSIRVGDLSGQNLAPGIEATMDIEWAHALAPLSQLIVVEDNASGSPQAFPSDLVGALGGQIRNGAEIASDSWGLTSPGALQGPNQQLASLEAQGLSLFAAGGDSLGTGGQAPLFWPAVNPSVVAVGGTTLIPRNPGSFFETYWNQPNGASSFGGTSYPAPYWEQRVTGQTERQVPDVAFVGNPIRGVAVYMNGGWWMEGGTSLGAPSWAAIWALCRSAVPYIPAAPQALYTVAASKYGPGALHNPQNTTYDPRTGIGSPDVANLITALHAIY